MIRFLSPGFAWALAAPAAVVVLYLLRRRFLPRQVPSVFLWRRSLRDYAANRPFQRLMKNLLLPLQVLAALALALALMRPALPGGEAGRTVFIFDLSGSMQAETDGRTRLSLAKDAALKRIAELPAEEEITVVAAGEEARRLLLNGTREEAEKVIASIACGRGGVDFDRALTLAKAMTEGKDAVGVFVVPDRAAPRITVFSDALRLSDLHTRLGDTPLSVVNVGDPAENRAVCSLTAEGGKAFARVANFGPPCTVTLTCEADGVLCGATEITIPGTEEVREQSENPQVNSVGTGFDIPETARTVRVTIREKDALPAVSAMLSAGRASFSARTVRVTIREKDALPADNMAETAVTRAKPLRVAVTENSVFLESALKVRPDLTVLRTEPEALPSTDADLYILGNDPVILTARNPESFDPARLFFGPFSWPEEKKTGTSPAPEVLESPLTAGVTMKNVSFRSWRPVTGGSAAVRLGEDPVIAWTEGTAVLAFDLHDTNLPLKYDFPVLIQNLLSTLLPESESAAESEDDPDDDRKALRLFPLSESNTLATAPTVEAEQKSSGTEQGRELKDLLLLLFLLLLVAEMGVSRYVS